MKFIRTACWLTLATLIFAVAAPQRASAQIPIGTTRTGTFVWDGERWIPAEAPPPPVEEIMADTAPPPLPVYDQPPCPAPNLMWTPGSWHFGIFGFYWVPGAWVPAPYMGALWTPPYWGWSGGRYAFHSGYWGPHIGFYGGVNYGGGYMGIGFAGGAWNGGVFAYNTAVMHVNRTVVTNVYENTTIVQQTTIINTTNVSFNGGPNGVQHQPTPEEQVALQESHTPPTTFQQQHIMAAGTDKTNLVSNNGGHPTTLAVARPLQAELHPAPAGFKPPAPRPVTELAKVEAPPSTIAAAKIATTKTASVAPPPRSQPAPMANSAMKPNTPPPAKNMPPPPPAITKSSTPPPVKAPTAPEANGANKPPVPPARTATSEEFKAPPKSTPPPPRVENKTEAKPVVKPPSKPPAKKGEEDKNKKER